LKRVALWGIVVLPTVQGRAPVRLQPPTAALAAFLTRIEVEQLGGSSTPVADRRRIAAKLQTAVRRAAG